ARRSAETMSSAISALSTALPRSISTSTPSPWSARSIASATRTASVPSAGSGASIPPASSIGTSPPIPRASSATPAASVALCETITRPTIGLSGRAGSSDPVRTMQKLDRVDGVHTGAVLDLPPARLAVTGGDIPIHLAQGGEQLLPDRHRDLVLLLLQAIRSGNAAAVGVQLDHLQLLNQREQVKRGLPDSVTTQLARGVVGNREHERVQVGS